MSLRYIPSCDLCDWVGSEFETLLGASRTESWSHKCASVKDGNLQNQRHNISITGVRK